MWSGIKCWNIYMRITKKKKNDPKSQCLLQPPHRLGWANSSACRCFGFIKGQGWLTEAVQETVGGVKRRTCQLLRKQGPQQWLVGAPWRSGGQHPSAGTWAAAASHHTSAYFAFGQFSSFGKLNTENRILRALTDQHPLLPTQENLDGQRSMFFPPLKIEFAWPL